MRKVFLIFSVVLAFGTSVNAQSQQPNTSKTIQSEKSDEIDKRYRKLIESRKRNYPPDISAVCRDGHYSYSKNRSGTCSGHGGVEKWVK
jgi:Protein of unknown function (DUF3761)